MKRLILSNIQLYMSVALNNIQSIHDTPKYLYFTMFK